jgi:hypothetical protein
MVGVRRTLLPIAAACVLLLPAAAEARPCSDRVPVFANGVQWIVYTGDSARERREIPCAMARRIARRYIESRKEPRGWNCRHTRAVKRCVRGGTYVDDYGYRQWRYLIGWHRAD